ncbi:MAG: hypothetical protein KGL54_06645 [Sphingomonadales bacterium]|nr:hypothetical protein [Sphingomonadales bacterium]
MLSLALTHALMAIAAWRLLLRDDLDRDPPEGEDGGLVGGAALPGSGDPAITSGAAPGARPGWQLRLPAEGPDRA